MTFKFIKINSLNKSFVVVLLLPQRFFLILIFSKLWSTIAKEHPRSFKEAYVLCYT